MKKVIITGANGFIGSSLIAKLVEKNIQVVAIDYCFEPSNLIDSELITKIKLDATEIEKLEKLLSTDSYDAFYHFAWRGVNGPDKANPEVQLSNLQMAVKCAYVAKSLGCGKFLCSGTVAEHSVKSLKNLDKTSGGMMYGVSKYCTHIMLESYCKNIGLKFVWMQFANIYGPGNKTGNLVSYTLGQLMQGKQAEFGPAMQPYDFIFIDDLIEAVYRIGQKRNSQNFYYIGSGDPKLLKEYLLEIGRSYGKEELINIGIRQDDGIKYTMDMFDNSKLIDDIGEYVSMTFKKGIQFTIENY